MPPGTRLCAFTTLLLGLCNGYTYQGSSVSQIYAAINTPTIHYCNASATWHSSNPDSWTRANYPTPSTSKSIFDPCPYGYRVPTSNSTASGATDFFGFPTPTNSNGASWLGSWWLTSGYRNSDSATLSNIGNSGWYWSASPKPSYYNQAYNVNFYSGGVTPVYNYGGRTNGFSVRCVQEEWKKF